MGKAFHRDIKPSNILLDEHGTAKVSDLGLVGIVAHQKKLVVDHVSGTPGYICPHYFETGEVSESSEVFSFGVVLLELLVNRDAAAVGHHGGIVYPLNEALRYASAGAHERALANLDPEAEWPLNKLFLARTVSQIGLACVGDPANRPLFADILWQLRQIAIAPQMGRLAPPLQQLGASGGPSAQVESFHTILPDSFSDPHLASKTSTNDHSLTHAAAESFHQSSLASLAKSLSLTFPGAAELYTRYTSSERLSSFESTPLESTVRSDLADP